MEAATSVQLIVTSDLRTCEQHLKAALNKEDSPGRVIIYVTTAVYEGTEDTSD